MLLEGCFSKVVKSGACLAKRQPFPKRQISDSSEPKDLADDSCKFDEIDRKFCYMIENTVGKGEIARYEQFLLFPQRFQKTCTADT